MEKDRYINSVNLNAGSRFPYLVLNVVDDQSSPLESWLSGDALA